MMRAKEWLRLVTLWGLGFIIVITLLSPVIYSRFISDATVTITEMTGTVIREPSKGVHIGAVKSLYTIKLDTGLTVQAAGLGKLPTGYRGKVRVQEAHKQSGGSMYLILGPYE